MRELKKEELANFVQCRAALFEIELLFIQRTDYVIRRIFDDD